MRKLLFLPLLLTTVGCGALVSASEPCLEEWRAGSTCGGEDSLHSWEAPPPGEADHGVEQVPAWPGSDPANTEDGGPDDTPEETEGGEDAGMPEGDDAGTDTEDAGVDTEEPECWQDGVPAAPGTPCGEDSFCGARTCDGFGECTVQQERCDDPRFPTCSEETASCGCTIGSCGIGGECFAGACQYIRVFRVEDTQDDAYQRGNNVVVDADRFQLGSGEVAGFRFRDVTIDGDERIMSARLDIGAPPSPSPSVCMSGSLSVERSLAADVFSDTMPLVNRALTNGSVDWDVCEFGGVMASPDVGPLLNELRGSEGELQSAEIALFYDHSGNSEVELYGADAWGPLCGEYCNPDLVVYTRVEGESRVLID